MTKSTLSSLSGPPSQSAAHQDHPNAEENDDNQSVSSQRIRKRDRLVNMFRPSSQKPKATNSQNMSPKSTIRETSPGTKASSTQHLSGVSTPQGVGIDHAVSISTVKSTPSDVHLSSPHSRSRLDVFPQNLGPPTVPITLPKFGARIETTPQLALCIGLLSKTGGAVDQQDDQQHDSIEDISPDTAAHLNWIKAMKKNPTEQERTLWLGACMVDEFAKSASKDSTEIAEMVLIGPVLDKEYYRILLSCMITAFDQSVILNVHLLQGLVQLVQSSPPASLLSDDLVKILSLLRVRLQGTHQQSSAHPYHLTLAVSRLLDVMADHKVRGLNRVEEHEPLSGVLSCLGESSDPYLMYQACYAFQALQYVPDDETVLQAVLRHSTGVVGGLVKVTAVMKLDLDAVLEGLGKLQEVLVSTVEVVGTVYEGACTLMESGRGVFDSLKKGYRSGKKRPWYAGVRAANVMVQAGQLQDLNRLICEAPCRRDPLFQWGICQLLGEIASDEIWDTAVRQQAVELLGELYKGGPEWGQDESVKTWMLNIIGQLSTADDQAVSATTQALLKELQHEQAALISPPYPLKSRLSLPTSSPTLSKVQKIPPLEYDIYRLQTLRLEQSQGAVYIPPMAKPSLKAKDDNLFPLMEKTQDFLASERQVMLVLGDSGAGKSTFNHHLEHRLWTDYKPGDPIPLFINLPAIDRPDQDLVAKQLKFHTFSDDQIEEIKLHRQLILICDGYDESQQLVNLHRTNSLNQRGQWNTKMIVSCRTQFLGPDYYSRFVPQGEGGHYNRDAPHLFQEAVIAPFSKAQIENYVEQYVPLEPRTWDTNNYMDRLTTIPNLLDLVRNPFLLSLALEALPGVTEGKQDLSAIKITRVQLYDTFVNHWLDVNRRRLERNNALSVDDRDMLNQLVTDGFTLLGLEYATRLALAIFDRQDGNPVVKYSHLSDKNTWKAEFFGPQLEVRLLRESSPLTRTGNLFRFVHRSMLEYFFSRAIYSPTNMTDDDGLQAIDESATPPSVSSTASLLDADGPLFQRNLLPEPSIIQFLCDRVKTNPGFEQQLCAVIYQSKVDAGAAIAAANAITILVRAGVHFNGADLQGVKISGADLSEGQFDSAQFQGADLTDVNLSRSWLRQADLSNVHMESVRFGEFPYLELDSFVTCCVYSPDGTMLAAGIWDYGLDVYSTATWTRVHQIGDTRSCYSVAFSPNSQQIVFGGEDKVRLLDCSSGKKVLVMEGHTKHVRSVAFSPCGMLLASAGEDGTVRLWNSQTGECRFVLKGHTKEIWSVKFTPDGRQILSGSMDGTIRYWDSMTGKSDLVLESVLGGVCCLAYSHDGRWIVSGQDGGTIQVWDAVAREPGPVLRGHTNDVKAVAFSLDDQWIASSSRDQTVRVWDSSTGVCVSTFTGHKSIVWDVVFSPDGTQLASGGEDYRVRLWDISSIGWSVDQQEHHVVDMTDVMYSYSSKDLYLLSASSGTIQQWDPVAGKPGPSVFNFPEGTKIHKMRVSPDGNQIAVGTASGSVRLWDRRTGTVGSVLKGHESAVYFILYSPCGRWLLTCDDQHCALLWDLRDTQQQSPIRAEVDEKASDVYRTAFSSSGHQIAILYHDNSVRIIDLPSRKHVQSKEFEDKELFSLAYSPNGQQFAIGCGDGSIYLWNVDQSDDEECIAKLSGHQDWVLSVAYSSCGQWIASGSGDQTVRLWRRSPEEPTSWSCVVTVRSFFGSVDQIVWSPVVPMEFVTHCLDNSVGIWRVSNVGGRVVVRMLRGSNLRLLCAEGLVLENATGLSPINQSLLYQRGAVDSSVVHGKDEPEP